MGKVILLDFSNLARRAFHFNKSPSSGAGDSLVALILLMLRKIKSSYPDYELVAVFDGLKATNLIRKNLFSNYKYSRYTRGTSVIEDAFESVYRSKIDFLYGYVLKYLGITCLKSDYLEADLVISAQVSKNPTRFSIFLSVPGKDMRVLSSDVDYATMIRSGVSWLRPTSKGGIKNLLIKYDSKSFCREFGAPPQIWPFVKLLIGDKSDGVPGIRGFGPVKSLKKVKELWKEHHPKKKNEFVRIIADDFKLDFDDLWRKFMLFDLSSPNKLIEYLVSRIPENTTRECFFEVIQGEPNFKQFRNSSSGLGFDSLDLDLFSRIFKLSKDN